MIKKIIIKIVVAMAFILSVLSINIFETGAAELEQSDCYQRDFVKSTIYMHDLADLLTDEEESKLINEIGSMCEEIDYNILFLTTNDADGKTTMVYSDDYMDILFPSTNENIAFVIDMDNREIYINTMGTAIQKLSDVEIDKGLDRGYDDIKKGKYYNCFKDMSTYCVKQLNDGSSSTGGMFSVLFKYMIASSIFAIAITAVVVIILLLIHKKANKAESATTYIAKENYHVLNKDTTLVRTYKTVQKDYYKPASSSSGGGGGSSHSSSSGRSHGGGGRSF